MKKAVRFLFFLLIGCVSSCTIYKNVHTDYDRSINFKAYKTFAWLPDSGAAAKDVSFKNTEYDNDIIRNNAKNYINHGLTDRGYRVNTDTPDVVLQLILLNEKKQQIVKAFGNPYPAYYYYNRYYYPFYYPHYNYFTFYGWGFGPVFYFGNYTTYNQLYVKGIITINMYDRKKKNLIWTGSAEGDIYNPDYIRFSVHPAVKNILKKFPVKSLPKEYPFNN